MIFKSVAGRAISKSLVKVLLRGEVSKRLKGFKSKRTKKSFEAALKLNEQGKVDLVFETSAPSRPSAPKPAVSKPEPGTSEPEATRKRLSCPACDRGEVIKGRRAWGCSRWRQGCAFTVAFQHGEVSLDDQQGAELIRFGQIKVSALRLVLDLEREGNIEYRALTEA